MFRTFIARSSKLQFYREFIILNCLALIITALQSIKNYKWKISLAIKKARKQFNNRRRVQSLLFYRAMFVLNIC